MSEIKLQKIKFPGLNNTYTIPIPEEVTSIEHGGTGATTAEEARNALGAAPIFNTKNNEEFSTGQTYIDLPNFIGSALISVNYTEVSPSEGETGETGVFLIICPSVGSNVDGRGTIVTLGCGGRERNAGFTLKKRENGWQFILNEKYTDVSIVPLCDYNIDNVTVSTSSTASGTVVVTGNVYLANNTPNIVRDTTYGSQGSND